MGERSQAAPSPVQNRGHQAESGGRQCRFRQLKPRPGRPDGEVAFSQCRRIRAATLELVDERGYDSVSVRAIVARAGVSTRTFYEQFAGKEECFLAAYDAVVRTTARDLLAAERGNLDYEQRLRRAFGAFGEAVARRPQAARVALFESFAAAPAVFERMRRAYGLYEALVADCFAVADDGVGLAPPLGKGIIAACAQVSRARLLAGREDVMPGEAGGLTAWALSLRSAAAKSAWAEGALGPIPPPLGVAADFIADERTVILRAAARLAARQEPLTVATIRAEAGLSRRSFYVHFTGLEDCVLAARQLWLHQALMQSRGAYLSGGSWPAAICRLASSLFSLLPANPGMARMAGSEGSSAGPAAVRWQTEQISRLATRLRRDAPSGLRPSQATAEASVAAAWDVFDNHLISGRPERLPRAVHTASYFVLAPVIGAVAAAEAIAHEARAPLRASLRSGQAMACSGAVSGRVSEGTGGANPSIKKSSTMPHQATQ